MLRLLCLALLLPACASTPVLSANFESDPTGPLSWAPDSDVGWVRYEPQGDPPGAVLRIDPVDAGQIAVIPAGPLPTQALRIAAPGISSPVSVRALPTGGLLKSGTITISFAGRFVAPEAGFSPNVQWIMVAADSNDEVLTYGAREFFYTDPDEPAVNPLRPFALVAEIDPTARTMQLTLISDGSTVVDGEELEFAPSAAANVAGLVFWGTEGTLVLDDIQIWQD